MPVGAVNLDQQTYQPVPPQIGVLYFLESLNNPLTSQVQC